MNDLEQALERHYALRLHNRTNREKAVKFSLAISKMFHCIERERVSGRKYIHVDTRQGKIGDVVIWVPKHIDDEAWEQL